MSQVWLNLDWTTNLTEHEDNTLISDRPIDDGGIRLTYQVIRSSSGVFI